MEGRLKEGSLFVIYVQYKYCSVVIFGNILSCRLRHVRNIYPGSTCKEITFQIERHRTDLSRVPCVKEVQSLSYAQ